MKDRFLGVAMDQQYRPVLNQCHKLKSIEFIQFNMSIDAGETADNNQIRDCIDGLAIVTTMQTTITVFCQKRCTIISGSLPCPIRHGSVAES